MRMLTQIFLAAIFLASGLGCAAFAGHSQPELSVRSSSPDAPSEPDLGLIQNCGLEHANLYIAHTSHEVAKTAPEDALGALMCIASHSRGWSFERERAVRAMFEITSDKRAIQDALLHTLESPRSPVAAGRLIPAVLDEDGRQVLRDRVRETGGACGAEGNALVEVGDQAFEDWIQATLAEGGIDERDRRELDVQSLRIQVQHDEKALLDLIRRGGVFNMNWLLRQAARNDLDSGEVTSALLDGFPLNVGKGDRIAILNTARQCGFLDEERARQMLGGRWTPISDFGPREAAEKALAEFYHCYNGRHAGGSRIECE